MRVPGFPSLLFVEVIILVVEIDQVRIELAVEFLDFVLGVRVLVALEVVNDIVLVLFVVEVEVVVLVEVFIDIGVGVEIDIIEVFVLFGLVARWSSPYTQASTPSLASTAGVVGAAAIPSAILIANNLLDIPGYTSYGKRSLAVRLGAIRTRDLYAALLALSLLCVLVAGVIHLSALIALLSVALALPLVRRVMGGAVGRDLVPVLSGTGLFELVYAALLAVGLGAAHHLG